MFVIVVAVLAAMVIWTMREGYLVRLRTDQTAIASRFGIAEANFARFQDLALEAYRHLLRKERDSLLKTGLKPEHVYQRIAQNMGLSVQEAQNACSGPMGS